MRILVTGATGFIGSAIANALYQAGHEVIGCIRNTERSQSLNPLIDTIYCDFAKDISVSSWLPRLNNIDVVINAVGIITETNHDTFEAIHVRAPIALFDACFAANIKRVIHISALGVSHDANTGYNNSKLHADEYLTALAIPHVILRPSWVIGANSHSFDVINSMSALPVIPVVGRGDYRVQPMDVRDLAFGIVKLIEHAELDGQVVTLGGPEEISIKAVHQILRTWQGLPKTFTLPIPEWIVRQFVKLGDLIFKGPINRASMDMLTRHNVTGETRFWKVTGIAPRPLSQILHERTCAKVDQFYYRLYLLMPTLRLSLALVWLGTAIFTAFFVSREFTNLLFAQVGMTGVAATLSLYGSCVVDFLLGLTLLFNYRLRVFGAIQFFLMLFYTLTVSAFAPEWWLHPYGPFLKNLPLLIATMMVAVMPGRK